MSDVISMGELLIDFSPAGQSEMGNPVFECNPGGAPANVAVQLARLGISAGFMGKVGNDAFGLFLRNTLTQNQVDDASLLTDSQNATTLAFVQLSPAGDRNFSFYRNPGADTQITPEEIDCQELDHCKLFHFGSLLSTVEPSRSAVEKAVSYAKEKGKIISYDPNWRPMLWKNQKEGISQMAALLRYADIVKVSDEELALVTGKETIEEGISTLLQIGISIVVVTLGPKGCCVACPEGSRKIPTYDVNVVDTTGSGDCFFATFLAGILQGGKVFREYTLKELTDFADTANAAGAACASKKGAIPALPDWDAIHACKAAVPLLHV